MTNGLLKIIAPSNQLPVRDSSGSMIPEDAHVERRRVNLYLDGIMIILEKSGVARVRGGGG